MTKLGVERKVGTSQVHLMAGAFLRYFYGNNLKDGRFCSTSNIGVVQRVALCENFTL